jgi:hypothetical protein
MIIRSADKPVTPEDTAKETEKSESKSINSGVLVFAIVVPVVLIIVVVVVITGCLIRRNKKSSLEGLCLYVDNH